MATEDKKQEQQKEDKRIDRMMTVIDSASQHARKVYYLYLGFIAYCAVTVFSTTDRQLAIKGDTAQLPILDISVPLDGFFHPSSYTSYWAFRLLHALSAQT